MSGLVMTVRFTLEVAQNKEDTTQQFKYWQSLFQQDYEMLFNIHHFFLLQFNIYLVFSIAFKDTGKNLVNCYRLF